MRPAVQAQVPQPVASQLAQQSQMQQQQLQQQLQQGQPQMQPQQQDNSAACVKSLVNIAIVDQKDFPPEVALMQELYSEFTMPDGRVLFECPGLVKATGIDLMNCPLSVVLKLRVRKRTPQGAMVLWHVVIPLPVISKYLLSPPHEWETWLGLFPHQQVLEQYSAEQMFTQAVHLISRPDFPKLRLRFTYRNPELVESLAAQRELAQQESQRRMEISQQFGRNSFEEVLKLTRTARDSTSAGTSSQVHGVSTATSAAGFQADYGTNVPVHTVRNDHSEAVQDRDRLYDGLCSALRFMNSVHQLLAFPPEGGTTVAGLPPALIASEVLQNPEPASLIDAHSAELHRCVQWLSLAQGSSPQKSLEHSVDESLLNEGIRMALTGMLEESDGSKIPRTVTNLSASSRDQLASIKERHPALWAAFCEVSAMVRERANLLEDLAAKESSANRAGQFEASQEAESKKRFEKLLAQQRAALQLSYDAEMRDLRRQLEDSRIAYQEKETEVSQLRAQMSALQQHGGHA